MVSKATGLSPKTLDELIARETDPAEFGFLGLDYIVVLELNEALAKMERGQCRGPAQLSSRSSQLLSEACQG